MRQTSWMPEERTISTSLLTCGGYTTGNSAYPLLDTSDLHSHYMSCHSARVLSVALYFCRVQLQARASASPPKRDDLKLANHALRSRQLHISERLWV
jgi:hypothetical protein